MSDPIHHHISPVSLYLKVLATLMILTIITVWVAFYDLGILNTFVAITIGVIKAGLVAWFFMHLRHSAKVNWVVAVGGVIWLVVMLSLTLSDIMTRDWIPYPDAW